MISGSILETEIKKFDYNFFVEESVKNNPYDIYLQFFNLFTPEIELVNIDKILLCNKTLSELKEEDKKTLPKIVVSELNKVLLYDDYLYMRKKLIYSHNMKVLSQINIAKKYLSILVKNKRDFKNIYSEICDFIAREKSYEKREDFISELKNKAGFESVEEVVL